MTAVTSKLRVGWVDYAKGICIVLVVAMHSTLGVEKDAGAISAFHAFIDWAKPFRMPDFFLISGLFMSRRIAAPWRPYLDSKVVHFAYFYALWMTISFLAKGYGIYHEEGAASLLKAWLLAYLQPFGTLWFIYMLAVFATVTKLLRNVSPFVVFTMAALLEVATKLGVIDTGYTLIDEFAARYVYYFAGYWLAHDVFEFADAVDRKTPVQIFAGLGVWALANYVMVKTGLAAVPGISLPLGLIGAGAVISCGILLSKLRFAQFLRYCGTNSIVIYLAFFLFMASTRALLLRYAPQLGLGTISALTTLDAVLGPLVLFWLVRETRLRFLFRRPQWARLKPTLAKPVAGWHSASHVGKPAPQYHPETR